jgi:hypothetical protein
MPACEVKPARSGGRAIALALVALATADVLVSMVGGELASAAHQRRTAVMMGSRLEYLVDCGVLQIDESQIPALVEDGVVPDGWGTVRDLRSFVGQDHWAHPSDTDSLVRAFGSVQAIALLMLALAAWNGASKTVRDAAR